MTYTEPAVEPVHWQDRTCDYCAGTVYRGRLYRLPDFDGMVCAKCAVRESGEPACDYCDQPTFGDYSRIDRSHTISIVCGPCRDHWQEEAER